MSSELMSQQIVLSTLSKTQL